MGGRLNVQRAVTKVREAVITRGGMETFVFLDAGQEVKIPIDGTPRWIKLDHILRLSDRDPLYRIIYEDDHETLQVSNGARLSANNSHLAIKYRKVDPTTGAPTGPVLTDTLAGVDEFIGAVPGWIHRLPRP
jgi:hypothetical protein